MESAAKNQEYKVPVDLGARSYEIIIENGALSRAGELIRQVKPKGRMFVVADANVQALHGETLLKGLAAVKIISIAPGEVSKSFDILEKLVNDLIQARIERTDMIIAFGGGVIGDLAGFAASVTLRGVDFVQIPTSLLAQVDSSVGGKTGINLKSGKNLVGAFHQPRLVIADPDLLDTLDGRQLRAGYAEIAKIALVKDAAFFDWCEKNIDGIFKNTPARPQAIATACRLKAEIVARDERESDERMLLNLGHTFGHALEALTGYNDTLLHGEAVSIGTAMAFRFSSMLGLCEAADTERTVKHLQSAGLPVSAANLPGITAKNIIDTMLKDKKVTGGRLTLILTKGVGKAFVSRDVDAEKLNVFLQQEMK